MKKHKDSGSREPRRLLEATGVLALVIAVIFVVVWQIDSRTSAGTSKTDTEASDDRNQELKDNIETTLEYGGKTYVRNREVKGYLIIGTDISNQSSSNEEAIKRGYTATMADFLQILVVDNDAHTYRFMQLDRNTISKIPVLYDDGTLASEQEMHLCDAYYYGHDYASSSENQMTAVETLLKDTTLDGYASFTMDSIPILNDIVGGVTLTFDQDYTEIDPQMKEGATLTLDGDQADRFVRSRFELENATNEYRMSRQKIYLNALIGQMVACSKADSKFPTKVQDALGDKLVTSINGKDTGNMITALVNYEELDSVALEGEFKIGDTLNDGDEHEEFYPTEESLMSAITDLFYTELEDTAGEG